MFPKVGDGNWCLHSDSDPRWNMEFPGNGTGYFINPKIESLKKQLGEPPADLRYWFYED